MQARTCPFCKQDIPLDAVKCHYCREWVNRRYQFKRILIWAAPALVVWVGMMVFFPYLMERFAFLEREYWQYPEAIRIVSHHPSYDEEGRPCVLGTIKNVSAIPWRSVTVQADYFDRSNNLVDSDNAYSLETLAPGQERNFKIVFGKKQRGAEYHHYRVHIAGAEDASRF